MPNILDEIKKEPTSIDKVNSIHSVEYFHIYTDETINGRHTRSLDYLKRMVDTWDFKYKLAILVDDYNPVKDTVSVKDILGYLEDNNVAPDYWALESNMVKGADLLLNELTDTKLKRSYLNYIKKKNKYPCSLLTAVWYLKRLGLIENKGSIRSNEGSNEYVPSDYLLNILPSDFKPSEARAFKLITSSTFQDAISRIQDIFYPTDPGQERDFF